MVLRPFVEEPKGSVANYPYFERGKDSTMAYLYRLFQEKIVMFDGAMGTMIQKYKLGEEEYRGERFKVNDSLLDVRSALRTSHCQAARKHFVFSVSVRFTLLTGVVRGSRRKMSSCQQERTYSGVHK